MSLTATAIFALLFSLPEKSLNLASRRIRRNQISQINVSCVRNCIDGNSTKANLPSPALFRLPMEISVSRTSPTKETAIKRGISRKHSSRFRDSIWRLDGGRDWIVNESLRSREKLTGDRFGGNVAGRLRSLEGRWKVIFLPPSLPLPETAD